MNAVLRLLTLVLLTLVPLTSPVSAQTLVGDGQADDTAALQKLVDAGGSVQLPKGRYRLTKTVTVDLAKLGASSISSDGTATFIMAGPGPALKIVGTHGGTGRFDTLLGSVSQQVVAHSLRPVLVVPSPRE